MQETDTMRRLVQTLQTLINALNNRLAALDGASSTPTPTATNTPAIVLEYTPTPTNTPVTALDGAPTPTPTTAKEGTRYARFYTFTLDAPSRVTVTISSTDVRDTYLYLLEGSGNEGSIVNRRDSEIVEQIEAGTYTIEATTYALETVGAFTLTMDIAATGVSAAAGATR